MKYISFYFICCLVIAIHSPIAFSEESDDQLANCEQKALEMGIQEGEEFDIFVSDCLTENNPTIDSEEESSEMSTEQSE